MGTSDSGAWKLFIYPFIFIVVLGLVFSLIINPFTKDGNINIEKNPNFAIYGLTNFASYGVPINATIDLIPFPLSLLVNTSIQVQNPIWVFMPMTIKDFMSTSFGNLYYLPNWLQYPVLFIIYISLIYVIWVIISMAIP